jgi:hypothetical protein
LLTKWFARKERASDQDLGPIPHSSLTRWLRQGVETGICPLCRVAHKADREYMWHFSEEGNANVDTMGALAQGRGFCAEHTEMLVRIDRQMQSMLGAATIYAELFQDLARDLEVIAQGQKREAAPCPACANRDVALRQNARYLLVLLDAPRSTIAERFPSSPGLCFPHFELVWAAGGSARVRRLIVDVQRRAVQEISADLEEFIRKEGAEAKHEPKGSEQDAWQRAIWLTTGWPAPLESAGVPETTAARRS